MNENTLLEKLKKPFPIDSISWRIGRKSKDKKSAEMLCYIDARDVMDRLDEVCGVDWSDSYQEVFGRVVCTITIGGQSRSDGAGNTDIEGDKGGISDAFKRAAVKWGIGRYLYNAKNYNTWVSLVNEREEIISDFDVLKNGNNKKKLDEVAKKLSTEQCQEQEPTPQDKTKATKAVNKEIEKNDLDERYTNWKNYWNSHEWSQSANSSFRKFLEEAKDYDQGKLNELVTLFKSKSPEQLNDSMPSWA